MSLNTVVHLVLAMYETYDGWWTTHTICNLTWSAMDPPDFVKEAATCLQCVGAVSEHDGLGHVHGRLVERYTAPSRTV